MSTLSVNNGFQTTLPGLGKIRTFQELSQKRVTKAVREMLRQQFGLPNVQVSCTATLASGGWHGSCKIHREEFRYKITAGAL